MNPVAAVDAVSRGEPLATLQALSERLSQPPEAGNQAMPDFGQAHEVLMPGLAAALAEAAASALPQATTLDAAQAEAVATAQAQQGRATLGQMAQQSQITQVQTEASQQPTVAAVAHNINTSAAQQALAAPQLALAQASGQPVGATILAVPVLMTPLQNQASPRTARNSAVKPEPARRQSQQQGSQEEAQEQAAQDAPQDASDETPNTPSPGSDTHDSTNGPAPEADSRSLRRLLQEHASAEVQRELQAGRRVLVVLPQEAAGRGLTPARAALLGPGGMRLFAHARWWPGDAHVVPALDSWPQWRVFREGDPLRAPVLVSRGETGGGQGCRVLLGGAAPQLLDSRGALLELPERLRFAQALGGQWSVLLVLASAGVVL
jgi:hypothetical protein